MSDFTNRTDYSISDDWPFRCSDCKFYKYTTQRCHCKHDAPIYGLNITDAWNCKYYTKLHVAPIKSPPKSKRLLMVIK